MLLTLWMACNGHQGPGNDGGPGSGPPEPVPHTAPAPMDRDDALPNSCDAGDEAWVARAMPLVWGRRPHGAAEIRYWAQIAGAYGRDAAVRAMSEDPQYLVSWADWFTDALYVARTGDKEFGGCFAALDLATHDGDLTEFLRNTGPVDAAYPEPFDMADVIVDGLVADDVSTVYRAHLFARLATPTQGANVSAEELEYNRRVNYGELFYRNYLGRNLVCMECHNSEFSTTDDPDPDLDRTWQMPGHFERALLGQPVGTDMDDAYAMFRYDAITPGFFGGGEPWGWSTSCGSVTAEADMPPTDMLGQQTAYFIRDYTGAEGSTYDLERDLQAGIESLRGKGLTVDGAGDVDGQEAFAYLVAANLAGQVWSQATGYDLVVAHMFPRNRGQMEHLQRLADVVASSGFSMRELLVAVATDPLFNLGVPETCDAIPYGVDPVFDPWVTTSVDPHDRRNGATDAVHRLTARSLFRTAHVNLGWVPRDFWFGIFGGGSEETLQSSVGVFLRESDPGHRGTDFQGLLTFETEYGDCAEEPKSAAGDFIDQVLAQAVAEDATVGDVATALRDRITSGPIAADERPLVEDLLGYSFDDPADTTGAFEGALRLWCGVLLESPQFQLVTDDPIGTDVPTLARDVAADCIVVADLATAAGYEASCDSRTLSTP